jgi:UDP-2,3-diacylglucosamine hydrolase
MNAAPTPRQEAPIALVCGGGSLPLAVAESITKRGRKVVLFGLRGAAESATVERFPHHWMYIGQLGKFFRTARAEGCRDVVFIGSLVRPSIWQVHPDLKGLTFLLPVLAAFRGGDNHLLSGMGKLLEQQGFSMRGAHEVAPEILVPPGVLGRVPASERDRADIALGFDYLRATGGFDVGQAVVVAGKHVLAVEAAEGTDDMLARMAQMRASGRVRAPARTGVLVKAPKHGQDERFDLPSIGPRTIDGAARAKLAGIAVVAGSTIIAEPERLIAAADHANIFVIGALSETAQ